MSSTEIVVWQPSDASREHIREYRRHRRRERRWLWGIGLGCVATFAGTLTWLTLNQPPQVADAQETVPAPAAVTVPSSTVPLIPESVPSSTVVASWLTVRVLTPGFDGLGKLVTDGVRAPRVLPGDLGRAVIAVDADPSAAATVIVEGREWRVFNRSTVDSNELGKLVDGRPVVPVVVVVSSLPGDKRPYVEATS